MDWIKEHYVEVFACIGAVYTAARMIVALTPTPKDDKAVEKAGGILKTIATILGLDFKQGVNK